MGTCQTKENFRKTKSVFSSLQNPTLKFHITIWPLNTTINFKDESTCIKKSFQLSLQDLQTQKFQLFPKQNQQNQGNSDRIQKNIKCQVSRNKQCFELKFNREIMKSAVNKCELNQNDVCVIGATRYKLYKIVKENIPAPEEATTTENDMGSSQSVEDCERKCRICYCAQQSSSNPLISPCKCRGSIQFIHMLCLKSWLFGQISYGDLLFLETSKSTCKICKTNITQTPAYKSIIGNILSGNHHILTPYAIFQGNFTNEKEEHFKSYLVVSFSKKKQFKIGRSHLADITDTADPLMSRINSTIFYEKNKLWIKDSQSKHGTGIILKDRLILSPQNCKQNLIYQNTSIQISFLCQ